MTREIISIEERFRNGAHYCLVTYLNRAGQRSRKYFEGVDTLGAYQAFLEHDKALDKSAVAKLLRLKPTEG